jgi:molybdopterin synthase sulfur carrier subunit
MSLRILYFAALREAVGCAREDLAADGVATVGDVIATLAARGGAWQALAQTRNLRAAVNQVMATATTPVADGDELAFFPPVTGG